MFFNCNCNVLVTVLVFYSESDLFTGFLFNTFEKVLNNFDNCRNNTLYTIALNYNYAVWWLELKFLYINISTNSSPWMMTVIKKSCIFWVCFAKVSQKKDFQFLWRSFVTRQRNAAYWSCYEKLLFLCYYCYVNCFDAKTNLKYLQSDTMIHNIIKEQQKNKHSNQWTITLNTISSITAWFRHKVEYPSFTSFILVFCWSDDHQRDTRLGTSVHIHYKCTFYFKVNIIVHLCII